jgi:hypothetical protein
MTTEALLIKRVKNGWMLGPPGVSQPARQDKNITVALTVEQVLEHVKEWAVHTAEDAATRPLVPRRPAGVLYDVDAEEEDIGG